MVLASFPQLAYFNLLSTCFAELQVNPKCKVFNRRYLCFSWPFRKTSTVQKQLEVGGLNINKITDIYSTLFIAPLPWVTFNKIEECTK